MKPQAFVLLLAIALPAGCYRFVSAAPRAVISAQGPGKVSIDYEGNGQPNITLSDVDGKTTVQFQAKSFDGQVIASIQGVATWVESKLQMKLTLDVQQAIQFDTRGLSGVTLRENGERLRLPRAFEPGNYALELEARADAQ